MGRGSAVDKRLIQSLVVGPDGGLQIAFYNPDQDVRTNGVVLLSTLIIPADDQYDDEIEEVITAIKYLVGDVLDDLPHLPATPTEPA